MSTLYLCGAGNSEGIRLALRVNRQYARWDRVVLLDDDPAKQGLSLMGVQVVGPFDALREANPASDYVANLVARSTAKRLTAHNRIHGFGIPSASLIDPQVDIDGTEQSNDVLVFKNATVGALSSMGELSAAFMGSVVGHGSVLGRCCIVAPNAVINARVTLGDGVYVGTNASILPDISIGAWATIGAGSVAMQDVPEDATVMGVPGRVLMTARDKPKMAVSGAR